MAVGAIVDLVDVAVDVLVVGCVLADDGLDVLELSLDVLVLVLTLDVPVETFVLEDKDTGFEVEDDALLVEEAPSSAIPCINKVVYPPSLHHVIYEAQIPVPLGLKTKGIVRVAPAANVVPTAGNVGDVYPFPTYKMISAVKFG